MRRVAVIGASGFIGSRLVEQWHLERRVDVVPIVRRPAAAARALRFGLDCRVADAMDQRAMADALEGCDALVHAAAGGRELVTGSVLSVARAAGDAGVRAIAYLSSMSVHGWHVPPGTDEASPLSTRHSIPYGGWKVLAEQELTRACRERGVRLVVLRPGIVYGPRSQWIERFARSLLREEATVVDGGRGICNAVYVDNLALAIRLALDADAVDQEAFLISDWETVTWRELYEPICLALGHRWEAVRSVPPRSGRSTPRERYAAFVGARWARPALARVPPRPRYALAHAFEAWLEGPAPQRRVLSGGDSPPPEPDLEQSLLQTCTYRFPIDKARRVLGYAPSVAFDEACRRTVEWLRFTGFPVVPDRAG